MVIYCYERRVEWILITLDVLIDYETNTHAYAMRNIYIGWFNCNDTQTNNNVEKGSHEIVYNCIKSLFWNCLAKILLFVLISSDWNKLNTTGIHLIMLMVSKTNNKTRGN